LARPAALNIRIPPLGRVGDLRAPTDAVGVIIFAHGSGSSRLSPRNQHVALALTEAGLATLLFDLLTEGEAHDRANVFDIDLLAHRLVQAIDWVGGQPELAGLPIGLFGASTGAAAALKAAALRSQAVGAVVSRGGRPDLAEQALARVTAPTLLIVGGNDEPVLTWNRQAQRELGGPSQVAVISGATHLFEEAGALDEVVRLATVWFCTHLGRAPGRSSRVG
jgi:pimeloyl-ACP methyl ester carboxylesterase